MSDPGRPRAPAARRRTFRSADGELWAVAEREAGHFSNGMPRRSLIFENEGVLRRVYDYPAEWIQLTDAQLERLSWGR